MLILILVALWLVVLAPAFVKRLLESRSTGSIDSFHRSLHLLERTGPKLVAPAYRLDTAHSTTGLAPGQSGLPAVSSMPGRPNLVLLQPVDDAGAGGGDGEPVDGADRADRVGGTSRTGDPSGTVAGIGGEVVADASGRHYLRMHPLPADPDLFAAGHTPSLASRAAEYRAEQARRRRRDILFGLAGTVTITALLGIVDALHPLWVLSVLAGIALAAYVGLAAYAQSLRHGRGHARTSAAATRSAVAGRGSPAVADGDWDGWGSWGGWDADPTRAGGNAHWAATAGFPGAWDDDYQADDYQADNGYGDDPWQYEAPRRAVGGG
ncbi:MAG TPA: hypothetical protein VHB02_08015 [Acidimicrobiales bacterium]|nr:hypothetical protein [Acidimicrobiales bacterium]